MIRLVRSGGSGAVAGLQSHGKAFAEAPNGRKRCPRRPIEMFPGDGPGAARAPCAHEGVELRGMPLVFAAARSLGSIRSPKLDLVPTFDDARPAATEHFDSLARARSIAAGLIRDIGDTSVRVSHRDEHAIVGGFESSSHCYRLGVDPNGGTIEERRAGIDRMARLANNPPAADLIVLRPGARWQRSWREPEADA